MGRNGTLRNDSRESLPLSEIEGRRKSAAHSARCWCSAENNQAPKERKKCGLPRHAQYFLCPQPSTPATV